MDMIFIPTNHGFFIKKFMNESHIKKNDVYPTLLSFENVLEHLERIFEKKQKENIPFYCFLST